MMLALLAAGMGMAGAGEVTIVDARAQSQGDGLWRFDVTLAHADTGWDHYADQWEVVTPDGAVLGTRALLHPHVGEQPFTRFLAGVAVPAGVDRVMIRGRDSVHGIGPELFAVDLHR